MNKTAILFLVLALIVVAYLLFNSRKRNDATVEEEHHDVEGGCCGKHLVCEKNNGKEDLYFDDEELDVYKGKQPEEYSEKEIEEFRNVLYTMKSDEVDLWVQCLQQRGIELPAEIKEEVLLILQ
ncbi:MAG: phospholipase [Bacteroidaceae bacterium]|nr:phospholipase [Bacteroidaceae bacterium]